MRENLIIVTAFERLISKEVHLVKVSFWQVPQAKCLVPTFWEHVKGNLTTNRICQLEVSKLSSHLFNHGFPDVVGEIEFLEVVPLLTAAVSADGRHIEHPIPELDECATLHRYVEIGKIPKHPVYDSLQVVFSEVTHEARVSSFLAIYEGTQAILGKSIIKHVGAVPQLFFLFRQVGSTNNSRHNLLSECSEVGHSFRR